MKSMRHRFAPGLAGLARRRTRIQPFVLCTLLVAYLGALWGLRGDHLAGWELLGPAQGKALVHERGSIEALAQLWRASRNFIFWNPTNSALYGFFPGWLSSVAPWLYWAQAFNLALVAVTFLLALRLRISRTAFVAAIGASPALLSNSIVGYPYISGALPYAIALVLVYASRTARPGLILIGEAFAWLALLEVSFHCYELGKTFFFVPFLAAISFSNVSWRRRALWVAASLVTAWAVFALGKANVTQMTADPLDKLMRIPAGVAVLFRQFFIDWFLDGPTLAALGVLSCFWVRRDRAFWRLGFLGQVGLLALGAVQFETPGSFLRPRRILLFLFWTAILVAWTWRDLEPGKRRRVVLASLLAIGWAVTASTGYRFWRDGPRDQSLPYTYSQVDFFVNKELLKDARKLQALIERENKKHFIFYGYNSPPENTTDPQGLPERFYLQFPHSLFVERVLFVDQRHCRYSCVPHIDDETALRRFQETVPPFYVHAYQTGYDRNVLGRFFGKSNVAPVVTSTSQRFLSLVVNDYHPSDVVTVRPLERPRPTYSSPRPGMCLWSQPKPGPLKFFMLQGIKARRTGAMENLEQPITRRIRGPALYYFEANVTSPVDRDILIESAVDDEFVLLINGQAVADFQGPRSELRRVTKVRLPAGMNHLQGYYSNLWGGGVLKLNVHFEDGRPVPWSCGAEATG